MQLALAANALCAGESTLNTSPLSGRLSSRCQFFRAERRKVMGIANSNHIQSPSLLIPPPSSLLFSHRSFFFSLRNSAPCSATAPSVTQVLSSAKKENKSRTHKNTIWGDATRLVQPRTTSCPVASLLVIPTILHRITSPSSLSLFGVNRKASYSNTAVVIIIIKD